MFKNDEYSLFLNIFICLVLKHDQFTCFISLFRPLGYPIKPRPKIFTEKRHRLHPPPHVHMTFLVDKIDM